MEPGTFARSWKFKGQDVCREGCRFDFGFCFLISVTSRVSYCPSKKSHSFRIQFSACMVTLHASVSLQTERCCSHLAVSLTDPAPVLPGPGRFHQHRGCVETSSPGDAGSLLQCDCFPLKYSLGEGRSAYRKLEGGLSRAG